MKYYKLLDENGFVKETNKFKFLRMNERDKETFNYIRSLDPNISKEERFKLIRDYDLRCDEDTINAMDDNRPDSYNRQTAFLNAIFDLMHRVKEWGHYESTIYSNELLNALRNNNAEELLRALCGGGANDIAIHAGIIPYHVDFFYSTFLRDDERYKIIVFWDNEKTTSSKCEVDCGLEVYDFNPKIFKKYIDTAKITDVVVKVTPGYGKECNYFSCISEEEKERTNDEFSYYYCLDDEDEDIDPDDDNEE